MKKSVKEVFLGPALDNTRLESEKFKVVWGLPIYSSDTISSVAYAGEEILLVLFPILGIMATGMLVKIMCAIICLLLILVLCYRQTIEAYPQGGGAYIVGADNLGTIPGMVAASSLSLDYILTVAVSSCSGAAALVSAFPALAPYKALIAFAIICLLTWGNLRGLRESSVMFGVPTYFFIASLFILIITGFVKAALGYAPPAQEHVAATVSDLGLFILLKAFASGCTALTGVEAVANGVPSFREPASKHAKIVLTLMACVVGTAFISVAVLTNIYHIEPKEGVTAVASLATAIFGAGNPMFYVFQIATVIILSLAANTAFAGMPLLLAMVARDGYMPRQFTQRGSRLNFSNGVTLIFFLSSLLVFIFKADTHALLPLYATGVFVSFTISQAGMFVYWNKHKGKGWRYKAIINAIGTIICFIVCFIIAMTKFMQGAWLVVILIPLLVLMKLKIKKHYNKVADELRIDGDPKDLVRWNGLTEDIQPERTTTVLPVQSVNKSFIKALNYVLSLGMDYIEVYFVSEGDGREKELRKELEKLEIPQLHFKSEETQLRNVNEILLNHIDSLAADLEKGEMITVILPQLVCKERWAEVLHNQTSIQLKLQLSKRRDVAVISVPYIT